MVETEYALRQTYFATFSSFPGYVSDQFNRLTQNLVTDTFSRTISNGFGNADTGQAYSVIGGTASDYSVGSGVGSIALNSPLGMSRKAVLTTNPLSTPDFEAFATITCPVVATGNTIEAGVIGHFVDSTDYYMLGVQFTTGGTLNAFWTRVGGAQGGIVTQTAASGLTYTGGTQVNIHIKFSGTTHTANVWTTGTEPTSWQLSVTASDTLLDPATVVGLRAICQSGNTNTLPVIMTFDNFSIPNPMGWGNADTGQSWVANLPAFCSVNGSQGVFNIGGAGANVGVSNTVTVGKADQDVTAELSSNLSAAPTGSFIGWFFDLRLQDSNNYYRVEVILNTDDTVTLTLLKVVGGVSSTLGTVTTVAGLSAHASTIELHAQVLGSTFQARIWSSTASEPTTWTLSFIDTSIVGTNANFRVAGFRASGNTNTSALLFLNKVSIVPLGQAVSAITPQIGPAAAYTRWQLTRYTINILVPKPAVYPVGSFILYRGDPALSNQLDYTQQVLGDTSSDNTVELHIGDYVTGVWTITNPTLDFLGAQCQITFDGTIYVKGKRSY